MGWTLGEGGQEHKLVTSQASSASPRSQHLAIAAPHGEAASRVGRPRLPPGDSPGPFLPPQRLPRPHRSAPRFGPCAGPAGAVRNGDPGLSRGEEGFAAPSLFGLYWLPERRRPGELGFRE